MKEGREDEGRKVKERVNLPGRKEGRKGLKGRKDAERREEESKERKKR